MKKRRAFAAALLVLAAVLFAVPFLRGAAAEREEAESVERFRDRSARVRVEQETTGQAPFPDLREAAERYNQDLREGKGLPLSGESWEEIPLDAEAYGLTDGVFGVVEIPSCGIRLPLYLGASPEHLTRGACVLGGTSVPLGGESTHCAVAAHRGWYEADMFRHLVRIEPGDEVRIQNPWETLIYRVREVQTVGSDEIDALRIREGEDLLTLLTCGAWRGGWTTRVLVLCERQETT